MTPMKMFITKMEKNKTPGAELGEQELKGCWHFTNNQQVNIDSTERRSQREAIQIIPKEHA